MGREYLIEDELKLLEEVVNILAKNILKFSTNDVKTIVSTARSKATKNLSKRGVVLRKIHRSNNN